MTKSFEVALSLFLCVCVHFLDANWWSTGGREGHLRAAVVVEFGHPGAAHHSTVGVRSSVSLSVPETPDVALRTGNIEFLGLL